jgi:Fe-S-cluster containining protein
VLFAEDQRFTCAKCGRCCRRTTVPITAGEAEAYRRLGPDYDDAFEPIPGYEPLLRIRKKADGACVFLLDDGSCRIHKEIGFDRKPIACRLFPFSFHPAEGDTVVTTSFACPTVIANEGDPVRSQTRELVVLHAAWTHELPEPPARVEFVGGHALPRPALTALRGFLTKIIDRPGPDGYPDLRGNLRRIAVFLEDLSRAKVRQLPPEDFVEYVNVMGRHAMTNKKPAETRASSRLARLLFRGFLLAALSVQEHLEVRQGQRGLALRLRLLHLLAHLHGLAPGTARFTLRRATAIPLSLADDRVREIAHRYLHVSFETAGAGRRPLVDEVAMVVARLNAACVLAGMHAAAAGKAVIDGDSFTQGLLESADLAHADDGGTLSQYLPMLSAGLEALYLFPPATT